MQMHCALYNEFIAFNFPIQPILLLLLLLFKIGPAGHSSLCQGLPRPVGLKH